MRAGDDESLLRAYGRQGDEAAFRELSRRYGGLVYGACLRETRRTDLAEDATQAVFLALARKAGRLRVRNSLVPWLYAASKLASRNVLRTERRRPTVALDETVPAPDLATDDALFQALDSLSTPEREAVVLRFLQGLSLFEVGQAQGVSEDAARMRVQRALKRLRTEYVPVLTAPLSLTERLTTLALPKPVPLMTTPLILTAGGVAALALVGASTLHLGSSSVSTFKPAPNLASAQAKPPSSPAKTQPPSATVSKPSTGRGSVPMIDKPFTLAYHYTERDLRSQATRDADAERARKDFAPSVDKDQMTPEQLESTIASIRRPRNYERDMTFSFDGKTLYIECRGGGITDVFLVRGTQTYQFPQNQPGHSPAFFDEYFMLYIIPFPFIGPSLPYFPVELGGKVLEAGGAPMKDGKPIYHPGKVEIKNGKVVRILLSAPGVSHPYGTTVLSKHRMINGFAIAGLSAYTERGDAGLSKSRQFRLISSSNRSLPADRFVPETYLPEKVDFFVGIHGGGRPFPYDRAKGSLDSQIKDHLAGKD